MAVHPSLHYTNPMNSSLTTPQPTLDVGWDEVRIPAIGATLTNSVSALQRGYQLKAEQFQHRRKAQGERLNLAG